MTENKFGILFSGQGAQKTGMGLDLYANNAKFREKLDAINAGYQDFDIIEVLKNTHNELDQTLYVQPALVAISVALYQSLLDDVASLGLDFQVNAMSGLSLGEYSALIASEMISLEDGFDLLNLRAHAMESDTQEHPGKMAALLGPKVKEIDELCQELSQQFEGFASIANYNSAKQVVLGGAGVAYQEVLGKITEQNLAKKVVELNVAGAFHTENYQSTSKQLADKMTKMNFTKSNVPVISNTTGTPFELDTVKYVLAKQVCHATHFADCLNYMFANNDVDTVLEIGAGKTLVNFSKQENRKVARFNIEDLESYNAFLEYLKG